jgi:hypothetical protein
MANPIPSQFGIKNYAQISLYFVFLRHQNRFRSSATRRLERIQGEASASQSSFRCTFHGDHMKPTKKLATALIGLTMVFTAAG